MIIDYSVIGKRIRMIRKQNRLSRSQLSSMVGISTGHLGHIENGSKRPTVDVLIRTALSLNVSVDELLVDLDLPKNENTVFKNCSPREKEILEELIVAMKPVLQKHISKTAGV